MTYIPNRFGMSNIGNTSGTTGTVGNGIVFAGGDNVTLSQSINNQSATVTISAASQSVQTQNLQHVVLEGNTAGTMATISSGTMTLYGGQNITMYQDENLVLVSGKPNMNVGMSTLGNTSGTSGLAGGRMVFVGGDNITLSQSLNGSSGTITISGGAGGGAGFSAGMSNIGNTSGTSGTTNNQLVLAGGNNITLSQATGAGGNTVTISAGAGGGAAPTLSRWEYPSNAFTSLNTVGQGSLSIEHMYVPFNITGTAAKIGGSLSAATNTGATTASANVSLWMGIYTLNGSTLSLASSGSANNGYQWSQSASTTANTSINSMRQMTVPMNVNMTPGEYWVGAVISSATTYTSASFNIYGNNLINSGASGAMLTPIGSNTTAARDALLFQGIYTANTAAGPTSIQGSQINNNAAGNVQRANFYIALYNATY